MLAHEANSLFDWAMSVVTSQPAADGLARFGYALIDFRRFSDETGESVTRTDTHYAMIPPPPPPPPPLSLERAIWTSFLRPLASEICTIVSGSIVQIIAILVSICN